MFVSAANFKLPEKGEYFDEVIYTELGETEARPMVEMYNKEGRDAGYGQQHTFSGAGGRGNKRFRPNERPPWSGGGSGGGGSNFRGNNRGMLYIYTITFKFPFVFFIQLYEKKFVQHTLLYLVRFDKRSCMTELVLLRFKY